MGLWVVTWEQGWVLEKVPHYYLFSIDQVENEGRVWGRGVHTRLSNLGALKVDYALLAYVRASQGSSEHPGDSDV